MDTSNLSGRTVLVTGAGSGIGRETALLAGRRGADLVICDVDEAGLAETEARAGDRVRLAKRVDVADREQMRAFADEAGAVDLLVNNAGVGLAGDFVDTPLEDWDWIVSINLMGVVHGCHFLVPKMIEPRPFGTMCFIACLIARNGPSRLTRNTSFQFSIVCSPSGTSSARCFARSAFW